MAWLLQQLSQHPLVSLGGVFVALLLVFRLFSALGLLIDRLWIWLLRSPILLLKSLFGWAKKESDPITKVINPTSAIESETLDKVLIQLDLIQQQQDLIMQEITALKEQIKTKT